MVTPREQQTLQRIVRRRLWTSVQACTAVKDQEIFQVGWYWQPSQCAHTCPSSVTTRYAAYSRSDHPPRDTYQLSEDMSALKVRKGFSQTVVGKSTLRTLHFRFKSGI